ncbi:MAG: cation-translocating P-type ATPase [Candidatus Omnitrophica bacterium]|nr:cation-translocating P-type ATPase [Candidatus Omnitrophota bacterium]
MNPHIWHSLSIEETLNRLDTRVNGLTSEETTSRLVKFGPNKLKEAKKISSISLFLEQFKSFLIAVLLAATVISISMGEYVEGMVILAIVVMSAVLGFIQNFRAEKALQSLKKMLQPVARVIREGKDQEILAESIVPGDIVLVNEGDRMVADCRILEAMSLKVDEALLTGESVPAEKTDKVLPQSTSLSERTNMLFTGTTCAYGRARAIVVATGMQTEFGKIAASLEEIKEEKTPLQVSVDNLGKWLGVLTLAICLLVGILGILRGYPILKMFIWAIALAVAAVPEALPAAITICLALGTRRMVKRNALIRRLSSVETLGSTNIICSDKTGTLTKGEMSVRKIFLESIEIEVTGVGYDPKGEFIIKKESLSAYATGLDLLLRAGLLCNDSRLLNSGGKWQILGDPTEAALIVAARKQGLFKENLEKDYPRVDEIPFSSERKLMTTIHRLENNGLASDSQSHKYQDRLFAFSKGAGEVILERSSLSIEQRQKLLNKLHAMAGEGLRTLAFAYKEIASELPRGEVEKDFVFLGFMGMIDPPRQEVKEAISLCKQAGIKTVMITGDHLLTAKVIGREIGIWNKGLALSGDDLDKTSDEELARNINDIEIIARVSPQHKLRLVDAFQKRGDIVAMTGDGVNDAPALKKADIGVAMGITGTEVSKESSNLILLDDNFATIVYAVEEGRNIYNNIRKFITYLITDNIGALIAYVAMLIFGLPLPLTALQILFINLIMDGPKAIALAVEPGEAQIMREPPRKAKEHIINRRSLIYIFSIGFLIFTIVSFVYILSLWQVSGGNLNNLHLLDKDKMNYAMTMFFVTLIMARTFNAFNCRSFKESIFRLGFFTNKWLILAFFITLATVLPILYIPGLNKIFEVVPLSFGQFLSCLFFSSLVLIIVEMVKFIGNYNRRKRKYIMGVV